MNINEMTDKKELAYLLIQHQRQLTQAQQNCQALERRIVELEQAEQAEQAEMDKPKQK